MKIRGNRIEIHEVESTLEGHDDVGKAVVVVRKESLVAYLTRSHSSAATKDDTISVLSFKNSLREWMIERLPPYMVPAAFIELDTFPTSHNDKIDQTALPDPFSAIEEFAGETPISPMFQSKKSVPSLRWSCKSLDLILRCLLWCTSSACCLRSSSASLILTARDTIQLMVHRFRRLTQLEQGLLAEVSFLEARSSI